jgi:hypothetical protein
MNGNFYLDLQEVMESADSAEVVSLFFPMFGKAVIIDTRSFGDQGPLVQIMPMVASPRERLRSLRPAFPRVNTLTVIPWPRYVNSLVTLGVWDRIVRRLADSGHDEAVVDCASVLDELRRLEKAELGAVVSGQNYYTVWSSNH